MFCPQTIVVSATRRGVFARPPAGYDAAVTKLALLGTGTMGLPMARNLLAAGFSVQAWNRRVQRAQPLVPEGAAVFEDPGAATRGCSTVITMLTDADAVLAVASEALPSLEPSGTWIQMSTIGISGIERCAELADRMGVTLVDAPVLGTREPAEQGRLVILAAGPDSARVVCEPVFEAVGSRTMWLGAAGAATRCKVVVNGWIVGVVAVLAETISLAEALEVDPALFFEAVKDGPLDLPYARVKGAAMMAKEFDDASFALSLSRKDGDLLLAAAADVGLEVPVMDAVVKRLRAVEDAGHGDEDMAATYWASARGAQATAQGAHR